MGVVAAMKRRTGIGELIDTKTKVVSASCEGLDLGIVYKSRTIDECVDLVLKNVGLSRSINSLPAIKTEDHPSEADRQIADTQAE